MPLIPLTTCINHCLKLILPILHIYLIVSLSSSLTDCPSSLVLTSAQLACIYNKHPNLNFIIFPVTHCNWLLIKLLNKILQHPLQQEHGWYLEVLTIVGHTYEPIRSEAGHKPLVQLCGKIPILTVRIPLDFIHTIVFIT